MIDYKYINDLIDAEDFCKVLETLDSIEKKQSNLCSNLLILKGRCIQLSDCKRYTLDDAKMSFYKALKTDEHNIQALIELGWFYYTIENHSKKAFSYFNKAMFLSKKEMLETIEGCSYCINEYGTINKAIDFIEINSRLDTSSIKIKIENE